MEEEEEAPGAVCSTDPSPGESVWKIFEHELQQWQKHCTVENLKMYLQEE